MPAVSGCPNLRLPSLGHLRRAAAPPRSTGDSGQTARSSRTRPYCRRCCFDGSQSRRGSRQVPRGRRPDGWSFVGAAATHGWVTWHGVVGCSRPVAIAARRSKRQGSASRTRLVAAKMELGVSRLSPDRREETHTFASPGRLIPGESGLTRAGCQAADRTITSPSTGPGLLPVCGCPRVARSARQSPGGSGRKGRHVTGRLRRYVDSHSTPGRQPKPRVCSSASANGSDFALGCQRPRVGSR